MLCLAQLSQGSLENGPPTPTSTCLQPGILEAGKVLFHLREQMGSQEVYSFHPGSVTCLLCDPVWVGPPAPLDDHRCLSRHRLPGQGQNQVYRPTKAPLGKCPCCLPGACLPYPSPPLPQALPLGALPEGPACLCLGCSAPLLSWIPVYLAQGERALPTCHRAPSESQEPSLCGGGTAQQRCGFWTQAAIAV